MHEQSTLEILTQNEDICKPESYGGIGLNDILVGDCLKVLKRYPNNYFDLIITSPPYANRRKKTYGGIHPDRYVDWFIPRSDEFKRVLKPRGTFILNIKEIVVDGERHTYVIEIIERMREHGWLWTEEFIWHKRNCHPGKWPNRFRDAWERCLQFNKRRDFKMYQKAVMEPIGDWAETRLNHLSKADRIRTNSQLDSGFGRKVANWVERDEVYPTNVRHLATECGNVNHNAAFPISLPNWFIRAFTKQNDIVLDPFSGSGTVGVAAKRLGRNYVLIDIKPEFKSVASRRIASDSDS